MIEFRLKQILDEKRLSIGDLVELTKQYDATGKGVHRNTVSKLINGNSKGIQFDTLDLFCKALDIDFVDDLIRHERDSPQ
ncbi:helix-turn-helix domain-containing protein [Pseudogracilibacillus sp. SO30301A]|uniref:helix-turn-helix domain-containing protein n=1 Tax=Pseudogracilibacillus sp. SO30301A TaxID=3098291 RepID=UPI00300E29AD